MKLGRLRIVENQERSGRSSDHYHHVLVLGESGLETLVMTDRELDSLRKRSLKNPEDLSAPNLLDKAFAWVLSLFR